MAITTTANTVTYTGTGATSAYTVPYPFLSNAHLVAQVTPDGEDTPTTLALGVDYTLTGAGGATGTLTLTDPLADGATLDITRTVPLTQLTAFRSQGSFSPALHENALDLGVMASQQLQRQVDGLGDDVDAVDERADTLEAETADLSANLSALATDVAAVESDTATLDTRVEAVEARPTSLVTDTYGVASAAPLAGTYTRGAVAWNNMAADGGNAGWVCVAGGTPGSWMQFGAIGQDLRLLAWALIAQQDDTLYMAPTVVMGRGVASAAAYEVSSIKVTLSGAVPVYSEITVTSVSPSINCALYAQVRTSTEVVIRGMDGSGPVNLNSFDGQITLIVRVAW